MSERHTEKETLNENPRLLDIDDLIIIASLFTEGKLHAYGIHRNTEKFTNNFTIPQPTFQRRLFKLVDKGFVEAEEYMGKSKQITYIYKLTETGIFCLKFSLIEYKKLFEDINLAINQKGVPI